MSALFDRADLGGIGADPERVAAAAAHLVTMADPAHGGSGVEGKQAYVVEVVEAWRIAYWVLADDPAHAVYLAEQRPVQRVRQRAQRAAFEVISTELLGEGGPREGVWPPYMPVRRTEHYGVSTDPELDHPVPHDPKRGEFA